MGAPERLKAAVERDGGRAERVALAGRAVVAAADVSVGDVLVSLPAAAPLTAARCAERDDGSASRAALDAAAGASEWDRLCVALAVERGKGAASAWAEYIAALPAEFTTPLWWSAEQLAALEATPGGGPAAAAARAQRAAVEALHGTWASAAADAVGPGPVADVLRDRRLVLWAHTCVSSRAFNVRLGGRSHIALLPLVDLMDHDPTGGAEWREGPDGCSLEVVAKEPVARGEPVCLNYGARSNTQLMLSYGFCLHPNPHDTFSVLLTHARGGQLQSLRQRQLARAGCERRYELGRAPELGPILDAVSMSLMPDAELYRSAGGAEPRGASHASTRLRAVSSLAANLQSALRACCADEASQRVTLASGAAGGTGRPVGGDEPVWMSAALLQGQRDVLRAALGSLQEEVSAGGFLRSLTPCSDSEVNVELVEWAASKGIESPGVRETSGGAELGWTRFALRVESDAGVGDFLARVPREAIIDTSAARRETAGLASAADARAGAVKADDVLVIGLLHEFVRGTRSPWAPFVAQTRRLTSPITALEDEECLEDTAVGNAVSAEAEELVDRFGVLRDLIHACEEAFPEGSVSFQDIAWAVATVDRLALDLPLGTGSRALVPLLGFVPAELRDVVASIRASDDGRSVELVAACELHRGESLVVPLESASNIDRLLLTGNPASVDERNPWETYEVSLGAMEGDEQAATKSELMAAAGLDGPHHLSLPAGDAPVRLLAAAALCVCDAEDEGIAAAGAAVVRAARDVDAAIDDVDSLASTSVFVSPDERASRHGALRESLVAEDVAFGRLAAALDRPLLRAAALQALTDVLEGALDSVVEPTEDPPGLGPWSLAARRYARGQAKIVRAWAASIREQMAREAGGAKRRRAA